MSFQLTVPNDSVRFNMISCLVLYLLIIASSGLSEPVGEVERYKVVVIGAGVSGFSAAAVLLDNNLTDIVVLEASNRIGGRIHSVEFGGVTIDLGAEFCVGEVDNIVYELASPHELLTSYGNYLKPDMHIFANTSGHIFDTTRVATLVGKAYTIWEEDNVKHFNGSVGDYFYPRLKELLRTNNVEPELGEAIQFLVSGLQAAHTAADSLEELGAQGLTEYWDNVGDPVLKWKTGGYKTIFDLISKTFLNSTVEVPVRSKVLLNKKMIRIEQKPEGVEVKVADGSTYIADHVIITVSLGVLKKQAADIFHPPLPELKTTAIETLGFGCVLKVFLLFPERWWPNDKNIIMPLFSEKELNEFRTNSVHGNWSSNTPVLQAVINNNRMLMSWFFGASARFVQTLTDEQVVDGYTELLDKLLGKTFNITRPESILRSNWCSNPLVRGTYSFRSVASDRQNISNNDLEKPILDQNNKPVILFGGEATNQHSYGTVHGAIDAGRREAVTIINYLKKDTQLK